MNEPFEMVIFRMALVFKKVAKSRFDVPFSKFSVAFGIHEILGYVSEN